jgi:hypothetical protein
MANNTSYGTGALQNNTSGINDTAIGAYSAYNNTDGSNNTAIGTNSSFFTTSGANNTSLGAGSLCNNTTGSLNTAIGSSALEGSLPVGSVGDKNTAIGVQALYSNMGDLNTALGAYAALGVTGGSFNTFLGSNSSTLNNISYNYSTAIGYGAIIDASNQIMMGGNASGSYPNVIIPGLANYVTYIPSSYDSDTLVPKQYVDQYVSGISINSPVVAISLTDVSGNYNASAPGSITAVTPNPLIIDGVTIQDGSGVLLNGQIDPSHNGVYTWSPGTSTLTRRAGLQNGDNAVAAYVFVRDGNTYAKTAWVQVNNPAIVGDSSLNFVEFYNFDYKLGRGLDAVNTGGVTYINVDTSLNFINFLDSNTSDPSANGTLALGTNTNNSIVIGPTGTSVPIQAQSIIQAQQGITGATGSFTNLTASQQISAPGGITGATGSFQNLTCQNGFINIGNGTSGGISIDGFGFLNVTGAQVTMNSNTMTLSSSNINQTGTPNNNVFLLSKFPSGITGATGSFTNLTASQQISAPGGITGATGSFNNLYVTNKAQFVQDISVNTLTIGLGTGNISSNTVVGVSSLKSNTTGTQDTAIGYNSLFNNTTGGENTAIGYQSLYNNTGGSYNTAIGNQALLFNSASEITAVGHQSLYTNTTGANNTAMGSLSLSNNSTGTSNTAIGYHSLMGNTTGSENTAIGKDSLKANTTGNNNAAFGYYSLYANTTGSDNLAIGSNSLFNNTTGSYNIGVGTTTLQNNSTGSQNTAIGYQSLEFNNGGYNTAIGYQSLYSNTDSSYNTAIGYRSLYSNTDGSYNTALGYQASLSGNYSNSTAIGAFAQPTSSNQIMLGGNIGGYPQVVAPGGITGATGSFNNLTLTNATLTSSGGSPSSNYLTISINGTNYYIALNS